MKGWLSAAAFAFVAFAAALPASQSGDAKSLLKRVVTPDGTCGGSDGYTCPTSSSRCCSQWGWCGDDADYCGAGCQSAYGSCSGSGSETTATTAPSDSTPPPTSGRAKPGNVPYGAVVSSCSRPGVVALTFDDGPSSYTSQLLDILSGAGVRATFFLNGRNWGGDDITSGSKSALVQRMVAEGHQIASHTWDHADLATLSDAQVSAEMTQLETALMGIIGKVPTYMRAPYFSCGTACLNVMNSLGYHVIGTDLDTLDWQGSVQSSKDIFANALSAANPSSSSFLPLAHDVHSDTVSSLTPFMIATIQERGFRTATVGECMGDPAANWYRTV